MKSQNIFPHINDHIESWPVAKLSKEKSAYISRLNNFVFDQLIQDHENQIYELINKTIVQEKNRIKNNPWKVDPPDDKIYWKKIEEDLESIVHREDKNEAQIQLLKKIINRYNSEIVGNFHVGTFKFSRIFLLSFFKRIFNKYFEKRMWRWGNKKNLQDKIILKGPVEQIRNLFQKGTIVIVPTHYSNLDSIMVGYAIDSNVGLPAFSYGAGLNLYNIEVVGYFIDRLGAFRVDRRKKNPIYLECLKSMTGFSIFEGTNCLFFPGGTRSRSGKIEEKLKLGMISSVIEAQRFHVEKKDNKKIFIVPMTMGYHFVLEAPLLIDQHLRTTMPNSINRKPIGPTFSSIMKFLKDIYTKSSEVYISFGEPLDVFGNKVNEEGVSLNKSNKVLNMEDYFTLDGQLTTNTQRESVYAKHLADAILSSYIKYNVILSSNVVAFVAFHLLYDEVKEEGLAFLLNRKFGTYTIMYPIFEKMVTEIVRHLKHLQNEGQITLSDESWDNVVGLILTGIKKLGIYHSKPVLQLNKKGDIIAHDMRLLYFYHNRLTQYGLEEYMNWPTL